MHVLDNIPQQCRSVQFAWYGALVTTTWSLQDEHAEPRAASCTLTESAVVRMGYLLVISFQLQLHL
eukprot:72692-Prorocentrum_lima.AAC.1